ncbi:MAG: malate synthase A [Flavobacteriaceae bacterium]|nr:malate synthase A [Flavobacteriaceae bacterium]
MGELYTTENETITVRQGTENMYTDVLTPDALSFLRLLHEKFNSQRLVLLEKRQRQQEKFDKGTLPSFPIETQKVRDADWVAGHTPEDLLDRRVEITGPVDRKMVINALNSGANTFMADFEDSTSPTWDNVMQGQQNMRDAINKSIAFTNAKGKKYQLNENIATLIVRPRGWHLNEKNLLVEGEEMSGSLVDFGLYMFHNAKNLLSNDTGPYFYLPKLEHYLEARLWNEVFYFAQEYLRLAKGTIKATVLIETITASFQLDEIIYELKDHIVGLNCGRWDYIFSYIKAFRNHKDFIVPDRDQVTMTSPFMDAYSRRVIEICHKRNIHAIGGMAAQIPIKNDEAANEIAYEKVRKDKEREAKNGHDGTWVAHPGLVPVAKQIFDKHMPLANQKAVEKEACGVTEADLIELPKGTVSRAGVAKNVNVGILYITSWLEGQGAAALYHLMEDAATAEISRSQVWQWLQNGVTLNDGTTMNKELLETIVVEETENIKKMLGEERYQTGRFALATKLFTELVTDTYFENFLTLKAYPHI